MQYRSTNADGRYVHFGGALVAGVEFGSAVELNPASSGNPAVITVAGDETNKALTIKGKGTGALNLGSSLAGAVLNSSATTIGAASTTPIAMIQRYRVDATVPALSSAGSAESTVTVLGLTTNSVLVLQNRVKLNSTVTGVTATCRCSTVDELVIEWHNISLSTLSGSTQSFYLLQVAF